MAPSHYLAKDTYVRFGTNIAVLLQATTGEYFALQEDGQRLLSTRVEGWPRVKDAVLDDGDPELQDLLRGMVQRRLLTDSPENGKSAIEQAIEGVQSALELEAFSDRKGGIRSALVFRAARHTSDVSLRSQSLGQRIARLRARKTGAGATSCTAEEIAALLAPHVRGDALERLADGRSLNRCLLHMEYLAHFEICPDLIFGFRGFPFESYCWIQHEKTALLEDFDIIRSFIPILSV